MTSLIARLEASTLPIRELDYKIAVYLFDLCAVKNTNWYTDKDNKVIFRDDIPPFTSSIDAAVALAERVLPGWVFDNIGQDYHSSPNGYLGFGWTVEMINGKRVQGQAPTLPLALCIAILKAKEASHDPR